MKMSQVLSGWEGGRGWGEGGRDEWALLELTDALKFMHVYTFILQIETSRDFTIARDKKLTAQSLAFPKVYPRLDPKHCKVTDARWPQKPRTRITTTADKNNDNRVLRSRIVSLL